MKPHISNINVMTIAGYVIPVMLSLVLFMACNSNSPFERKLDSMDSLMRVAPDSAYHILQDMQGEADKEAEHVRMHYQLSLADAQNKAYIDFTTDSVMLTVADYYDHHGTPNEQMRAHYLLGCTYRDLNDVPMELQCFQEAVEKADTISKDCDLYTLSAIYGQMANIYHNQFLPEEELAALDICESIDKKTKDTLRAVKAYELHLRPYLLLGNTDSVLAITKNARKRYLELNNKQQAAILLNPAINILLSKNEIDSAQKYMDIYEKESGLFINGKLTSDNARIYYHNKGRLFVYFNQLDSAKYYFYELLKSGWKEAAYEGFVSLYKKTNDPDSLAKYAILYVAANDSARASTSTEVIAQMSAMYDYTLRERKNKDLQLNIEQEKNANKTMRFYVALVTLILVIIVLLSIYGYKEHYRKNKQKLADTITRFNATMQQLKESEDQKREIEKRLLSSKDMTEDLIRNYKKEIDILNDRIQESNVVISNLRNMYADVDFDVWIDNFVKAEIVFKLHDLLNTHSVGHIYTADNKLWKQIYAHFHENAYSFITHIQSEKYGLNEIDIKVVMLTVLGFKTNDVALLLDKSSNHITNIRKRIASKLCYKETSARELRKELLSTLKNNMKIKRA